jgi:transposase
MEIINPICCGIDVHNASLVTCMRTVQTDGSVRKEERRFGTMQADLRELSAWLQAASCPVVAMESTGVYWEPVYHALRPVCDVIVGNPADMVRRPGKKTDRVDADWIAELCAHGLILPSFIPTPEIRALRDLTRTRVELVQSRTQSKNRVHKILQGTGIKLACVASDIFGKSGREMLDALVSGERNAGVLAQLARRKLRAKIPQLELALDGQFTEHHAHLIRWSLQQIDQLNQQVREVDEALAKLTSTPAIADAIRRLCTIPGVEKTAARAIVAEIGLDMTRFVTAERLSAWSGVSPGNKESAGKRRSGRTRRGNRWLRRILVQCAWTDHASDNFLGQTFRRLRVRLGDKKTAMAVAHKILVIVFNVLLQGSEYQEERYDRLTEVQEEKTRKRAVKTLERLGYHVVLAPKQDEAASETMAMETAESQQDESEPVPMVIAESQQENTTSEGAASVSTGTESVTETKRARKAKQGSRLTSDEPSPKATRRTPMRKRRNP